MQMTFLQFARIEAAIVAVWLDLGVYIKQYYCATEGLGLEDGINSADKNYSPELMRRGGGSPGVGSSNPATVSL